ncbi:MAG: hypothetical protein JNL72_15435 [Flavipsychrobacter sp.]|nr:hypothetical protein [Flavipsychrobacter sp.]
MSKKLLFLLTLSLPATWAQAQTTYIPLNYVEYGILDRLETRSGSLSDELFLTSKPVMRKSVVNFLSEVSKNSSANSLSKIDRYNISRSISKSGEWAEERNGAIDSRTSWFNTFYKKQPDFLHVNKDNFFLVANPVISYQYMKEQNNPNNLFWSGRGAEIRGIIADKVGFYTYFTDNQENVPSFVNNWIGRQSAVPGADFYQTPKPGVFDYMQARGYVDFAAVKDHINVTFGYDKHFIGDGMRSMFLSDFAAGAAFLRLTTKVWKLNYQNLYMELTPQYVRGADRRLPHKYATMHHLSVNVTRWLNIGAFESVMFSRRDRYEFGYLNPIIFYRQVERAMGSPDNVNLGMNAKIIIAKHVQLYGQVMLDEFKSKELFGGRGWWGNKFGLQAGLKYFDAFTIKNLDIQGEINAVRPYSYSHYDSTANYTHYNQPMAHPLGAGFAEAIGVIRYQPAKNLFIMLKGSYYKQGLDSNGTNFGSNIFMEYDTRTSEYGVGLINGVPANCLTLEGLVSYEIRPNIFLDLGATQRTFTYENNYLPEQQSMYYYGGLRINIARRDYNYY